MAEHSHPHHCNEPSVTRLAATMALNFPLTALELVEGLGSAWWSV